MYLDYLDYLEYQIHCAIKLRSVKSKFILVQVEQRKSSTLSDTRLLIYLSHYEHVNHMSTDHLFLSFN